MDLSLYLRSTHDLSFVFCLFFKLFKLCFSFQIIIYCNYRVGRTARAGKSGRSIAFVTQYDIEPYQRLEALLKMKLPQFPCDESTVLVLLERVSEAQRIASREFREMQSQNPKNKKRRRDAGTSAGDGEEGGDDDVGRKNNNSNNSHSSNSHNNNKKKNNSKRRK